jgi:S1-C subfamily serine protease
MSGQCTGFEVEAPSGKHYILTASHCSVLEDDYHSMLVTTESGDQFHSRVIAIDMRSDSLLLEGSASLPALRLADSDERGEHVRVIGHGLGLDTWEVSGTIIQMSEQMLDWPETVMSGGILPGHSGSPVLDPSDHVVGIASVSNYFISGFVKLSDLQAFLAAY